MIQVCELQGYTTVQLEQQGLYLTVHQDKIKFPNSISTLYEFNNTFRSLCCMAESIEKMVHHVTSSIGEAESRGRSLVKC